MNGYQQPPASALRRLAVSPDSAWLAVGRWHTVELHDLVREEHVSTFVLDSEERARAFALTFTSERQLCAVGHSDLAPVVSWDVLNKQVISASRLKRHSGACIGRFTPDAQYLVTASDDLGVYRLEDSHLVGSARVNMIGRALAVSADGTRAATFGAETLRVWSLPNLTELASWNLLGLGCWDVSCALAFTPNAASVIAAGWDGVLRRIRIPSGGDGSVRE